MVILVLFMIKVFGLRHKDANLQIVRHNWIKLLYGKAVLSNPAVRYNLRRDPKPLALCSMNFRFTGLPLPLCGIANMLYLNKLDSPLFLSYL